jgi:chromosome segregation protein
VQLAQTQYYETNAEVSNLESQVKHTQEARDRLSLELEQMVGQAYKSDKLKTDLESQLKQLLSESEAAEVELAQKNEELSNLKEALPEAERAHTSSQKVYADAQRTLSEAEQNIRFESSNIEHLTRSINETSNRIEKLLAEQGSLSLPNESDLKQKQMQLSELHAQSEKTSSEIAQLKSREQTQVDVLKSMREQAFGTGTYFGTGRGSNRFTY